MKYRLSEDVRGETHHPMFGRISFQFPKGRVTPKSEQEEYAITEVLAAAGLAEPVADKGKEE